MDGVLVGGRGGEEGVAWGEARLKSRRTQEGAGGDRVPVWGIGCGGGGWGGGCML